MKGVAAFARHSSARARVSSGSRVRRTVPPTALRAAGRRRSAGSSSGSGRAARRCCQYARCSAPAGPASRVASRSVCSVYVGAGSCGAARPPRWRTSSRISRPKDQPSQIAWCTVNSSTPPVSGPFPVRGSGSQETLASGPSARSKRWWQARAKASSTVVSRSVTRTAVGGSRITWVRPPGVWRRTVRRDSCRATSASTPAASRSSFTGPSSR